MVRRVELVVSCDLCGTEGAAHHRVATGIADYRIDLCAQHELALAEALAPYTAAARPVTNPGRATSAVRSVAR